MPDALALSVMLTQHTLHCQITIVWSATPAAAGTPEDYPACFSAESADCPASKQATVLLGMHTATSTLETVMLSGQPARQPCSCALAQGNRSQRPAN